MYIYSSWSIYIVLDTIWSGFVHAFIIIYNLQIKFVMNVRPHKISYVVFGLFILTAINTISAQNKICLISPPKGFVRTEASEFGNYLRNLPLKPIGTPVRLHNGKLKSWQGGAYAVIDMEIGSSDLQQCADAVMRLRAEYLWHSKQYEKIHFDFTNGMRVDYIKWAQGYRIRVNGNNTAWYKATAEDYSYQTFRKYMNQIFMYAGTASLSQELVPVRADDLQIGDIFIVGGHPGHAMVIVDMAEDKLGNKAIMVAQSYMPAQDIHIVTNLNDKRISPWYIIKKDTKAVSFPEYYFKINQIGRFK